MSSDKELADAVVALGVGWQSHEYYCITTNNFVRAPVKKQNLHCFHFLRTATQFVRDWRVAGALMEKLSGLQLVRIIADIATALPGPLPRAIIEACVGALGEKND